MRVLLIDGPRAGHVIEMRDGFTRFVVPMPIPVSFAEGVPRWQSTFDAAHYRVMPYAIEGKVINLGYSGHVYPVPHDVILDAILNDHAKGALSER